MARKRILLADDNRSLRVVLASALGAKYEVTAVGDGSALETELATHPYDLVITDLNLPKCSGSAALRRADEITVGQERITGLEVPVVVITGMDEEDEEVRAVRRMVNVKEILFKPVDLDDLCACVDSILAGDPFDIPPEQPLLKTCVMKMKKVLVVDDDPDIRDLLSFAFEAVGFQVRAAATVETALELCQKTNFDLMLLDYALEEDIADDLIEQLEARMSKEAMPPILMVTGYGDGLTMARYEQHPEVKGIVNKPFEPESLTDLACGLLGVTSGANMECTA
ncbi:MAG: response regulator [Planctomycetota bacterium]|nr:response regulator [Planctomycetota bacterium]